MVTPRPAATQAQVFASYRKHNRINWAFGGFNNGQTWGQITIPGTAASQRNGWIIGYGGGVLVASTVDNAAVIVYSYDLGNTWTQANVPIQVFNSFNKSTAETIQAFRFFYSGGYYFFSTRGSGLLWSKDGVNWDVTNTARYRTVTGEDQLMMEYPTSVAYDPINDLLVVGIIERSGFAYYVRKGPPSNVKNSWGRMPSPGGSHHVAYGRVDGTGPSGKMYGWGFVMINRWGTLYFNADPMAYNAWDKLTTSLPINTVTNSTDHFYVQIGMSEMPGDYRWWALPAQSPYVYHNLTPGGTSSAWSSNGTTIGTPANTVFQEHMVFDGAKWGIAAARPNGVEAALVGSAGTSVNSAFGILTGTNLYPNPNNQGFLNSLAVARPIPVPTVSAALTGTITSPGPTLAVNDLTTWVSGSNIRSNGFEFELDTSSTFNSSNNRKLVTAWGATSVVVPPELGLSNGTWYVRARTITMGENQLQSAWSASRNFTISITDLATPAAPVVTDKTDYWPEFSFGLASRWPIGTTRIRYQIAADTDFTDILATEVFHDNGVTLPGNQLVTRIRKTNFKVPNGTFYVRAQAFNLYGQLSPWGPSTSWVNAADGPLMAESQVTFPSGTGHVTTSYPEFRFQSRGPGRQTVYPGQQRHVIQLSRNNLFSFGNLTITDPDWFDPDKAVNQFVYGSHQLVERLETGIWFARVARIDEDGLQTTWGAHRTFTVRHAPGTSLVSPPNGAVVNWDPLGNGGTWKFNDPSPGDVQTAFQVQIKRASDGLLLHDTGKVLSDADNYSSPIDASLKGVQLYWTVRTWDTDDVVGEWASSRTVTFVDPPVVTRTLPAASPVDNGRPAVAWTLGGTAPQASARVTFIDQLTGQRAWSVNLTTQQTVTPPLNVLTNLRAYVLLIEVTTTLGSTTEYTWTFDVAYVAPPAPTYLVTADLYENYGYVLVDWASTTPDAEFNSWTVLRREFGQNEWETMMFSYDVDLTEYHDWEAVTQKNYEYVVIQEAYRSGILLSSPIGNPNQPVYVASAAWWLIDPTNESNNVLLNVTANNFTDEFEEATYNILGRGRRKENGTHLGLTGSLTAVLRDTETMTARQRFEALREMRAENKVVVMRDPYGNFYRISLGNIAYNHVAGVGSTEMYDISVPILEVID